LADFLRIEGVGKSFGGVKALDDVSVEFHAGQIHAVLGENGAGKSTLMSVIAGFVRPDSGSVFLNLESVPLGNPAACQEVGIQMIHQHFTLVPAFTVQESFALSGLGRLATGLNIDELSSSALSKAKELGWKIDPRARISSLSVGSQQRVEILKALSKRAKVLIFDEPTAVLSPTQVEELFVVMRKLSSEGSMIILIAHKLSEVLAVADHVTVLRRGKLVASAPRSQVTENQLATWMVGELPPPRSQRTDAVRDVCIKISNLAVLGDRGETAVDGISLEVSRGEILGVGGVDGNGQQELAECLTGIRTPKSGQVDFLGARIGYIPQDRQVDGLAMDMSIADNLLAAGIPKRLKWGPFLNSKAIRTWAQNLIDRFDIRAEGTQSRVGSLSGGNQQKVVVARALVDQPDLLVVSNPTRGLDIRATEYVHSQIEAASRSGAAVILFSTDLDELAALSTRALFMSRGKLSSTFSGALTEA
jgi:simple sugar transport system ATP-binding protein